MLNSITYSLRGALDEAVREEARLWNEDDRVDKIWAKDALAWTGEDESKWLGWLNVVAEQMKELPNYRDFHTDIASAGFTDVLLMGMGGSSLCPEVLAITFGKTNFHILDSTVPAQVKAVEDRLDLAKTLFIVSSKSGSTLEPNCFKQYFFDKVSKISDEPGKQFVAVTDPGSKMEQIAKRDGFRYIFYGDPAIGGRLSALSAFGLTAAASMGLEVETLLDRASEMVEACRSSDTNTNPGALLGTVLGVSHRHGRDKLTIFTSPEVYDLGAWLEQLIAESTGKSDIAIIPIDREPMLDADEYYDDRVFAYISVKGGKTDEDVYNKLESIERSEHPLVRIELESIYHISQEFYRWEFATAVAGWIMGINPFNQPDVESAKIEARKLTDQYEQQGKLPEETPFFEADGISLFSGDAYAERLQSLTGDKSLAGIIRAHLEEITKRDYFALLAYVQMNPEHQELLQQLRVKVLESRSVATCLGFGPRFLHSTGQAYKGGGNNGVFLQVTSDDRFDLPVPGQKYTFGIVKAAQARGDFQVLLDRGRRALRVHLGADVDEGLKKLLALI
ncbi:MAG: bifunctional transaldolase/phosoglucose isomerase [Pyrinomonadaceae bacterium]